MKNKRKNSNYKADFSAPAASTKRNGKKIGSSISVGVIIFVSIFLAVLIIAGIIFGISYGTKNANAVIKYKGLTIDEGEAAFFASYYKQQYLSSVPSSSDTEEFWNSKANAINTHAEFLEYNTKEYMKQVLAANYIYDSKTRLSSADKRDIKLTYEEILDYRAGGNIDTFNKATEKYGFDYDDFKRVTEMLYKARNLNAVLYGADGSGIASDTAACEAYLAEYARVKLMFIRTERDFKLDENGNRIEVDGQDALFELTAEEKAKRLSDITTIRAAIESFNAGGNAQMNDIMFSNYLSVYKSGYDTRDANGFYFHSDSAYTKEFSEAYPQVVEASLNMGLNSYFEVPFDEGVCFIYKYAVAPGAYTEKASPTGCFSDFYKNAATKTLNSMMSEYTKEAVVTDKIEKIDFTAIPYNYEYVPVF